MAVRGSVTLTNAQGISGSSFIGAGAGLASFWDGGRTGVAVNATAYGTIALQVQGPSGTYINVGSSFLSDQVYVFDAVPGQYRLNNSASSSIAVFATMVPVKYSL